MWLLSGGRLCRDGKGVNKWLNVCLSLSRLRDRFHPRVRKRFSGILAGEFPGFICQRHGRQGCRRSRGTENRCLPRRWGWHLNRSSAISPRNTVGQNQTYESNQEFVGVCIAVARGVSFIARRKLASMAGTAFQRIFQGEGLAIQLVESGRDRLASGSARAKRRNACHLG